MRAATSLAQLAEVLGYPAKILSFIVYKGPASGRYSSFSIPKRSGGTREIHVPDDRLKGLQHALVDMLEQCEREIAKERGFEDGFSHGFEHGRSIITNAWQHKSRRYVLNLDLQEFFPSINFGRVRGFFIKNKHYGLHPKIATIIAQIVCFQNSLPQGAPSSPIISNLVTHILDVRLGKLAAAAKCTYTRYADDLTFSTNQKEFPAALAYEVPGSVGEWVLSEALLSKISSSGFAVHPGKMRMQCRPSQQIVTGLTVNEKVNVRATYYRAARAMCHSMFQTGAYHRGATSSRTLPSGKLPKPEDELSYLEGVLAHVYHVKRTSDLRSGRLDPKREPEELKKAKYPAYRGLYKDLLYYKHFVVLDKPLIVCEGKSDNIYLRSALKALDPKFPALAKLEDGKLVTEIRFLQHSRVEHDILELSGGSGNLKNLVERYERAVYRFRHRPLKHPVIVLVDNDSGSNSIFSVMSQRKITVNHTTTAPFYHICFNLYIVKTPEIGAKGTSCIEDLFDASVRSKNLDGRTLSLEKEFDCKLHYGKMEFAERVVRQEFSTINFDGLIPLLQRIEFAMADYSAKIL